MMAIPSGLPFCMLLPESTMTVPKPFCWSGIIVDKTTEPYCNDVDPL